MTARERCRDASGLDDDLEVDDAMPRLSTRCAHWGWQEHRFRGCGVSTELARSTSFIELTALSVLGRRLPEEHCRVLEEAAVAVTMADPRIWPLKLTRVVAAYGGRLAAAAAGFMILEDARIGPYGCSVTARQLVTLEAAMGERADDLEHARLVVKEHLDRQGPLWGFGTPYRKRDERLVVFRECLQARQRTGLRYWRAMDAITAGMQQLKCVEPNMALGLAAACLDMGVHPGEVGPLVTALMFHTFFTNALEGAEQAPEVLRRLGEESTEYVGRIPRDSPRRVAHSMPVAKSLTEPSLLPLKVG